jgi:hypothetical protein
MANDFTRDAIANLPAAGGILTTAIAMQKASGK